MFACAKFAFSRGTERHEIYIEYIHWNSANIVHSIEYSVNGDYSVSKYENKLVSGALCKHVCYAGRHVIPQVMISSTISCIQEPQWLEKTATENIIILKTKQMNL